MAFASMNLKIEKGLFQNPGIFIVLGDLKVLFCKVMII